MLAFSIPTTAAGVSAYGAAFTSALAQTLACLVDAGGRNRLQEIARKVDIDMATYRGGAPGSVEAAAQASAAIRAFIEAFEAKLG